MAKKFTNPLLILLTFLITLFSLFCLFAKSTFAWPSKQSSLSFCDPVGLTNVLALSFTNIMSYPGPKWQVYVEATDLESGKTRVLGTVVSQQTIIKRLNTNLHSLRQNIGTVRFDLWWPVEFHGPENHETRYTNYPDACAGPEKYNLDLSLSCKGTRVVWTTAEKVLLRLDIHGYGSYTEYLDKGSGDKTISWASFTPSFTPAYGTNHLLVFGYLSYENVIRVASDYSNTDFNCGAPGDHFLKPAN